MDWRAAVETMEQGGKVRRRRWLSRGGYLTQSGSEILAHYPLPGPQGSPGAGGRAEISQRYLVMMEDRDAEDWIELGTPSSQSDRRRMVFPGM